MIFLIILEQDEQDEHHAHHAHYDHFWFKQSEQSLLKLWLLNDYLIIALFNHLQKSFNTKFSFKIFILKITFLSCFFIVQQKILSCIAKIFLSVQVLSVLSYVFMNTAVTCKRNVVSTINSIIASSVCISIASAILLFQW